MQAFTFSFRLSDEVISVVGGKVVEGALDNLFVGEIEESNGFGFLPRSGSPS